MKIDLTPTTLIDQLRAWFHPKDRSVVIANDCFIEMDEQAKPGTNPPSGRDRIYPKSGNLWYVLDSSGTETLLGGPGGAPHDILSATHSDATVSAVTRGDLIFGNSTPKWDDLAIGQAYQLLQVNAGGTDPAWASFDWDDVGAAAGADMVHTHASAGEGGLLVDTAALYGFPIINAGRLTLTSGTPVTTADVTAATTLYYTPYVGDRVAIYDGSTYWNIYSFSEIHIHTTDTQSGTTTNGNKIISGLTDTSQLIPGMEITGTNVGAGSVIDTVDSTTQVTGTVNSTGSATNNITFKIPASKLVDVFAVPVAGAVSLRFGPLWTNITTRATALTTQNGVDVLTGSTTWRWLGTVGTTTTAGQIEDSISKRFVWNYYNTVLRYCRSYNTNTSWNLVGATAAREFNAGTGQVRAEIVLGKARLVHSLFNCYFSACQNGQAWNGGIGFDATNAYALGGLSRGVGNGSTSPLDIGPAFNITLAAEGYHYITQVEGTGGTATNYPGGGTYSQLQVFLEN